jgi:uncharacterized protein YegL
MEGFQNFNTNFDPNTLANQTSSAIMFLAIMDCSGSISSFEHDMNNILEEVFMKELKNSHRKDDIIIKGITFDDTVSHKSGFMPITTLPSDYLQVQGGGLTALYDAVLEGLEHAKQYREDLEAQGIDVRTNICIISDGDDNRSSNSAPIKIKALLEEIRRNEAWASSFTITFIGIGTERIFRNACKDMGLDPDKVLVTIGSTAKEIRQVMGVVSQSVSSSSTAAAVSF